MRAPPDRRRPPRSRPCSPSAARARLTHASFPPPASGKIYVKAKLVKGLHGLGCTINEQNVIVAIDPSGVVASQGVLMVGDKITEVNRMPVQFGSLQSIFAKGSAWDVGVERSAGVHHGPADYSLQLEQQQHQKLNGLQTAAGAQWQRCGPARASRGAPRRCALPSAACVRLGASNPSRVTRTLLRSAFLTLPPPPIHLTLAAARLPSAPL